MNFDYSYRYLSGSRQTTNGLVTSNTVALKVGPSLQKYGTPNSNWRTRLSRGEFVGSDYVRTWASGSAIFNGACSYFIKTPTGKYDKLYFNELRSYETEFPSFRPIPQQLVDRVLEKYWNRVREATTTWESLASAAELGSTVTGILTRYKSLRVYALEGAKTALRRTRRIAKSKLLKQVKRERISNLWLEYHLGIKPLVLDFEDAISSFLEPTFPPLIPVVAFGDMKEFTEERKVLSMFSWDQYWFAKKRTYTSRYRVEGFYTLNMLSRYSRRGFDPTGAVLALWEVVPLSFVLDYFVHVEGFLTSKLMCGLQPVTSVTSTHRICHTKYEPLRAVVINAYPPEAARTASIGKFDGNETEYGRFQRTCALGIGVPRHLVFGEWNKLHWSQKTTCAALLAVTSRKLRAVTKYL